MAKIEAVKRATAVPAGLEIKPSDGYDAMLNVLIDAEPNFLPENIADGIAIWGKTGTAKPRVTDGDWPFDGDPDIPAKDKFDEKVQEKDPYAPTGDYFVLADDLGNITIGYMGVGQNEGFLSYNGAALPPIPPEWDKEKYPYLYISPDKYGSGYQIFAFDKKGYYEAAEHRLRRTAPCSWWSCECDPAKEMVWSDFHEYTHTNTLVDMVSDLSTMIYLNFNVVYGGEVVFSTPEPEPTSRFTVSYYNNNTTEFKAIGWIRVSYHTTGEHAGTWTVDDFSTQASGGWNYLKNLRACTRDKLCFRGKVIWPNNS